MRSYVDSHVHVWKLSRGDYGWLTPSAGILYQDYGMEQLKPLLAEHRVEGVIAVQAAPTLEETAYLLEQASAHPSILGVVGWADLTGQDAGKAIAWLAEQPGLSGIRVNGGFGKAYQEGYKPMLLERLSMLTAHGLTIDWLLGPGLFDILLECLEELPEMTAIVNHLGAPPVLGEARDAWQGRMEKCAQYPHTAVKLSGMLTQGDPKDEDRHRPLVQTLCEQFGSDRLLFGSDWPVALRCGGYRDTIAYMEAQLPASWSEEQKNAVRRDNAMRIYCSRGDAAGRS
ncbi:amidohydrolase family protein [Paenibacillus sp. 1P07SE]|uniref:amidohydrolase family protein n=1 Tax=Paenibacillus sp. 1P07SE TaxID=3132209 RepID=UPI0039A4059E